MLNSILGRFAIGIPAAFLMWLATLKFIGWIGIDFPPSSGLYEFLCLATVVLVIPAFFILTVWVFRGQNLFRMPGTY